MGKFFKEKIVALLALLCAVLCFGAVPIFLRYFTGYIDAWTANGLRYGVAMLVWLPYVLMAGRGDGVKHPHDSRRNIWRDAMVPASVNLLGQIGWAISPYYLPASIIGFVVKISFLWTIMFGMLWLAEERRLLKNRFFFIGAILCVVGVLVMSWVKLAAAEPGDLSTTVIGFAVIITTSIFWGGYGVSIQKYLSDYSIKLSFAVICVYTSISLLILMLLLGDFGALLELEARTWFHLVISALIGIALAHVMYYRAIRGLGSIVASGLLMAAPFVTYLGSVILLGEQLTSVQLLGGSGIVVGGLLLVVAKGQIEK